jgi:hypothetical protein
MSIVGAAPVKKAKHKAHQTAIDASGGSLTKSAFSALPLVAANFVPLVTSLAATAGGVLPRAGKGGSMSIIGSSVPPGVQRR